MHCHKVVQLDCLFLFQESVPELCAIFRTINKKFWILFIGFKFEESRFVQELNLIWQVTAFFLSIASIR